MMVRNFAGQPSRESIFHRLSLLAISNALVRSMKATKRPMFCSLHFSWICRSTKIMSVVPLFARKPHWLSGVKSSMMEGIGTLRSDDGGCLQRRAEVENIFLHISGSRSCVVCDVKTKCLPFCLKRK